MKNLGSSNEKAVAQIEQNLGTNKEQHLTAIIGAEYPTQQKN
jgi:hypothetical protein